MPQKKCKVCGKEFYVKPYHLKLNRGHGQFCSRQCRRIRQKRGKFIPCYICGKKIWKKPKEIKNSKSGKFFCGKSCQAKWRNKEFSGEKHPNWKNGENVYKRIMKESGTTPICANCKIKNKKVLVIHHKDHDRKNNKIENLVWLCRNCHYLIHLGKTF